MANTLNKLQNLLDSCECLHDVLKQYTGSDLWNDIYSDLNANDTLWVIADQNDMKESAMSDWIKDHLDNSVECKIFQECGSAGGWPVVKVECLDMVFFFDWVVE